MPSLTLGLTALPWFAFAQFFIEYLEEVSSRVKSITFIDDPKAFLLKLKQAHRSNLIHNSRGLQPWFPLQLYLAVRHSLSPSSLASLALSLSWMFSSDSFFSANNDSYLKTLMDVISSQLLVQSQFLLDWYVFFHINAKLVRSLCLEPRTSFLSCKYTTSVFSFFVYIGA